MRDFTAPDPMPFEKRLVLVVWVPKYLRGNVGHAAIKIRATNHDGQPQRLDYISWWPAAAGKGIITPRVGGAQTFWQDQQSEMTGAVGLALFLAFFQRAYLDPGGDGKTPLSKEALAFREGELKKFLKTVWTLSTGAPEYIKRWQRLGFEVNFANLGELLESGAVHTKTAKLRKGSNFRELDGRVDPGLLRLEAMNFTGSNRLAQRTWLLQLQREIGKHPDEKVPLPGAHLRTLKGTSGHLPVWGLASDLIRVSWVTFRETRNPKWQLVTNTINCASVAWNRMLDGFMDAFITVPSKPVIEPQGALTIGRKLEQALATANQRQEYLQGELDASAAAVRALVLNRKLNQPDAWRKLLSLDYWKAISSRRGQARPTRLTVVDGLVAKFARARQQLTGSAELKLVETILIDERKLLDLKQEDVHAAAKVKELQESLTANALHRANAGRLKVIRKSQVDTTQGILHLNFETVKARRVELARLLVKLQEAVYACARSMQADNPRRPAVLLLGHCAACAFYEAAHLGEFINLIEPQTDGSFLCLTVRQFIHHAGPILGSTEETRRTLADGMNMILNHLAPELGETVD